MHAACDTFATVYLAWLAHVRIVAKPTRTRARLP